MFEKVPYVLTEAFLVRRNADDEKSVQQVSKTKSHCAQNAFVREAN